MTVKDKRKQRHRERIETGICIRCAKEKPDDNSMKCMACRVYCKDKATDRYWKYRIHVLNHYGGCQCVCCGEEELAFLAIDHGPGAPTRKDNPDQLADLASWIIKNNYPEGFRVLCHNCNMATRYGKLCPHQRNKPS